MAKLTLSDLSAFINSGVTLTNANWAAIETALENTLSRDGTSPNAMGANLDMNSNRIINLPTPISDNDAVRLADLSDSDATGAASALLRSELLASTGASIVGFAQSGIGTGLTAATRTASAKLGEITTSDDFSDAPVGMTGVGKGILDAITTGTDNTAVGYRALAAVTSNSYNTAVGSDALTAVTNTAQGGAKNTAMGYRAAYATTGGQQNVAIGMYSLRENLIADDCVAVGAVALQDNKDDSNTAVGAGAGQSLTGVMGTHKNNVIVGAYAMQTATSGLENVVIGYNAMNGVNTASYNTAIGSQTMQVNTSGEKNTALGWATLALNTTGSNNVAVGYNALAAAVSVDDNVAVGRGSLVLATAGTNTALGAAAGSTLTTGTNVSCLGYNAQPSSATATNEMTLGNSSVTLVRSYGSYSILNNGQAFTGSHSTGSIANDATATITKPANGAAILLLVRESEVTGAWALFGCSADVAAMVLISSGGAGITWTVTYNTPSDVNVYQGATGGGTGDIIIQNRTGSNKTFRVAMVAAY